MTPRISFTRSGSVFGIPMWYGVPIPSQRPTGVSDPSQDGRAMALVSAVGSWVRAVLAGPSQLAAAGSSGHCPEAYSESMLDLMLALKESGWRYWDFHIPDTISNACANVSVS